MRTGSEIYDILANKEYNENVARFANILRDEMNSETLMVGVHILLLDLEVIISLVGPTISDLGYGLEQVVLDKARANGSYAGIEYHSSDWEVDEEGEYVDGVDDGLRWVGFTDIMATLNQVADSYVEEV